MYQGGSTGSEKNPKKTFFYCFPYADVMLMMTMLIMIMPRVMTLMMTMLIRELVDDGTVSLKRWPTTNTGGRSSMSSTGESVL